jgi:hypothetical protein
MMSERHDHPTSLDGFIGSDPTTSAPADAEGWEEADDLPAAVDDYHRSVDAALAQHLSDEVVESRLEKLRALASRRATLDPKQVDALVGSGHGVVRGWLIVLSSISGDEHYVSDVDSARLAAADVEQVAHDIVARAVVTFRDDLATTRFPMPEHTDGGQRSFLLACALHLPDAYRSWLVDTDGWDDRAQLSPVTDSDQSVRLRHLQGAVRQERPRVTQVLRAAGYPDAEIDEIIDVTRDVFDLASGGRDAATWLGRGAAPDAPSQPWRGNGSP